MSILKNIIKNLIFSVKKFFVNIIKKFDKRKRILLFSNTQQTELHITDYLDSLWDVKKYKIFVFYDFGTETLKNKINEYKIKVVKNIKRIQFLCVDLIVTADQFEIEMRGDRPPVMYLNHGFHLIGRNEGKDTYVHSSVYAYTKPDIICEPNKRIAETVKKLYPELSFVVRWTGWKFSEKQADFERNKEQSRRFLGIDSQEKVLLVASSWGENCLVYRYGNAIFQELKRLSKSYKIIVSFHPNVLKDEGHIEIEKNLKSLNDCGCIIRDSSIDWARYMAAADVVFSDYSTLTESAIYAKKKLVFSDYPISVLWCESVVAKTKEYFTTVKDISELETKIEYALNNPFPEKALKYVSETETSRAEYRKKINSFTKELLKENELATNTVQSRLSIKKLKFKKLKNEWERLYGENANSSPFQDYKFAKILLKAYSFYPYNKEKPEFFAISENGKIIMIAPLCKRKDNSKVSYISFGARFRVAYEDFIYSDSLSEEKLLECIKLLKKTLLKEIHLEFVSEKSPLFKALDGRYREIRSEICVGIDIPETVDEYLKNLSRKHRQNLYYENRKLNEEKWEVKCFFGGSMPKREYAKFNTVYLKRYREKWTTKKISLKRAYENFFIKHKHHNAVAINKLKSGFSAILYIDGEIAAISGGYVQKNRDYIVFHRGAINPKFNKYSVGKLLYFEIIKKMIKEYGIKYLDLSKGNESYKYLIGGKDYYQHCYVV